MMILGLRDVTPMLGKGPW